MTTVYSSLVAAASASASSGGQTPVGSRLVDVINIESGPFNASTENTAAENAAAIQRALDAASSGAIVYTPPQTYDVSPNVLSHSYSGLHLIGVPGKSVWRFADSGSGVQAGLTIAGTSGASETLAAATSFTGTWTAGTRSVTASSSTFSSTDVGRPISLPNAEVSSGSATRTLYTWISEYVSATSVRIADYPQASGSGVTGCLLGGLARGSRTLALSASSALATDDMIYIANDDARHWDGVGTGVGGGPDYFTTSGWCARVASVASSTVTLTEHSPHTAWATSSSAGSGQIAKITPVTDITLDGMTFCTTASGAGTTLPYLVKALYVDRLRVTDCTFRNCVEALYIGYARNVIVQRNTFKYTGAVAAGVHQYAATKSHVRDNHLEQCSFGLVATRGAWINVSNNTLTGARTLAGRGIKFQMGASDCIATGNMIEGFDLYGFYLSCAAYCTIANNHVFATGQESDGNNMVVVGGGDTNWSRFNIITGNRFSNAGSSVILAGTGTRTVGHSLNTQITNNVIERAMTRVPSGITNAIIVNERDAFVADNKMVDVGPGGRQGVSVATSGGAGAVIENNVYDNGMHATHGTAVNSSGGVGGATLSGNVTTGAVGVLTTKSGDKPGDVVTVRVALGTGASGGGIFAWQNPYYNNALIERIYVYVTTASTGACTVDIGTASGATTSSENLLDELDVRRTGVFSALTDKGTNGSYHKTIAGGDYITASVSTGSATGLVGYALITLRPLGA